MNFAKIVKIARTEKEMTRSDLAIKAGCTERAIEYWEENKRKPSLEMADAVLRALGITLVIGRQDGKEAGHAKEGNLK